MVAAKTARALGEYRGQSANPARHGLRVEARSRQGVSPLSRRANRSLRLMSLSYSSLIPPNLFILMAASGLLLALRWKRLGMVLAATGTGCLYLAATPIVAYFLIRSAGALAGIVPIPPPAPPPRPVIVLSPHFTPRNNPHASPPVAP